MTTERPTNGTAVAEAVTAHGAVTAVLSACGC